MLPDDVPNPPWKTIIAVTATISVAVSIQLPFILDDFAAQSTNLALFPTVLVHFLAYVAACLAVVVTFLITKAAAVLSSILIGYWKRARNPANPKSNF